VSLRTIRSSAGNATTDEPTRERWDWKAPAWIAMVAGIYFFSVGPVCRLCFDYRLSENALYLYRPVFELARLPGLGHGLAAYLNLWGSRWKAEYWDSEHGVMIR
jgi:hypothetical protein